MRSPILVLPGLLALLLGAAAPVPAQVAEREAPSDGHYTQKAPGRGGTGKVYMGREISVVVDHRGLRWLERPEREEQERPDVLVERMDLSPAARIADIGAGSGYLTFRIQKAVPEGKVIAVDIQEDMLARVRARRDELKVDNVETVLGTLTDPGLPPDSIDAALLVDAYHEFSHPREMMEGIVRALIPGGRVYLVEYRAEDPEVPVPYLHKMTEAQARREMDAVGLEFVENREGLPWQHLLVFRKPPA